MNTAVIYTDGACSQVRGTGRGPGGWGVIVWEKGSAVAEFSGGEPDTTNQRMELTAVIKSLESLRGRTQVRVHCDSAYVVNCFQDRWYEGWRRRGWSNSKREPVANRDLWERLLDLVAAHCVEFVKVKGHADDARNNRCDELARAAARAVGAAPPDPSFEAAE